MSSLTESEVPSDLIQLHNINRPSISTALHIRFNQNLFYTAIGPILVSINPFKWINDLYSDELKQQYATGDKTLFSDPHVFAKAFDAHYALQYGKNQSIIISGESGAGKTEATKQCLSYLAFVGAQKRKHVVQESVDSITTPVQQRILQASPILEAWGNAKTLRNDNSSRFGKYIEISFTNGNFEISGAQNTTYLLEKSRIVFQETGERNYHAFYQLIFGAPSELQNEFYLSEFVSNPNRIEYLNKSGCMAVASINEKESYEEVHQAFHDVGVPDSDSKMLSQILAAVLHMGNFKFVAVSGTDDIEIDVECCGQSFNAASELLGADQELFKRALLFKKVQVGRRASVSYSPLSLTAAAENCNALAKELYARTFDWIVSRINGLVNNHDVSANEKRLYIGILDIFGFEIFKKVMFFHLRVDC